MEKARLKRLNIGNTDRYYNLNLILSDHYKNMVHVTYLNQAELTTKMRKLEQESKEDKYGLHQRDSNSYIFYKKGFDDDTLMDLLLKHAGHLIYYAEGHAPYTVITKFASDLTGSIMFRLEDKVNLDYIHSVFTAHEATEVLVDCPIVVPDIKASDIKFALNPLKTNVDRVVLNFPVLKPEEYQPRFADYYYQVKGVYYVKPEIKFKYFEELRLALSLWGMYIDLTMDSLDELGQVLAMVPANHRKRVVDKSVQEESKWH